MKKETKKGTPLWKALLFERRLPWRYLEEFKTCNDIGLIHYLTWRLGLTHYYKKRRAYTTYTNLYKNRYVRKIFKKDNIGKNCFKKEILARKIFKDSFWISPILKKGKNWMIFPYYSKEFKLNTAVKNFSAKERLKVAIQVGQVIFDIFMKGYAHCDFHANNLFFVDGKLICIDFECIRRYPKNKRPPFPESYDIIGRGLKSPFQTNNMCYISRSGNLLSMQEILKISKERLLQEIVKEFKRKLKTSSSNFKTQNKRHTCHANLIYSSFNLPYFQVTKEEVQRDSAKRFQNFGITEEMLRNKKILDIGSCIGGMLFEAQKFSPKESIGIEYDKDKVEISNKIASYNGLNNVKFIQKDIDRLKSRELHGPFDVVFCLSVEAHLKNKKKLYSLLKNVTKDLLFFEGNSTTDIKEVERALKNNGFEYIQRKGVSNDDCIIKNNCRPLLIARK